MTTPAENLKSIRHYLTAIEGGTFTDIENLFTSDVIVEQLPNRIYPHGLRADRLHMSETFAKGRTLLSSQAYEIKNAIAEGNVVSVEVLWTGTLAIAFGSLSAGTQMRCHSAMFFEFRDGKIASQRNYDCFEPW